MTIEELRDLFDINTKIIVYTYEDDDDDNNIISMELTPLLMGADFGKARVYKGLVKAIAEDVINIQVLMPSTVFKAWKKFNDDYYKNH